VQGTPIGIAVYQNGVRIDEAFGDVVNWDFIPEKAIDRATLFPSNPAREIRVDGLGYSSALRARATAHVYAEGSIYLWNFYAKWPVFLSISYGALGKYPAAGKAGSTLILVIGLFDGGTFTADPDPTHRKEQPCWT
jgi:hypothetical protein